MSEESLMQMLNQIIFESIQEFSKKNEAVVLSLHIDNQKTISRKRRGTMTTNQIVLRASIDHAYKRDRAVVLNTVSFESENYEIIYKYRSCMKFNK